MTTENKALPIEEYIKDRITYMLQIKGQIDGILYNAPQITAERNIYTWIQGLVNELLTSYYTLEAVTKREKENQTLLTMLLGADLHAPREELRERAQALGEFYKEIRKRAGQDT